MVWVTSFPASELEGEIRKDQGTLQIDKAMAEFSLAPRLPSAWVRISQRSDTELLSICSKFVAVVPASNWRRSGEHMFKIA